MPWSDQDATAGNLTFGLLFTQARVSRLMYREHRSDYTSDTTAYRAVALKLGCSYDTLRAWCLQAARDAGDSISKLSLPTLRGHREPKIWVSGTRFDIFSM